MAETTSIGYVPVNKAGDTMTGTLTLNADPVANLEAATKQYVDAIAAGIDIKDPAYAATTADLAGYVYNNGVGGVGATLTAPGNGAFTVDGTSPGLNDRILVKDQTATEENGIYDLTTVGDGGTPAVLTRSTDFDQPAEITPGSLVIVQNGTVNALTSWMETATVATVGTDPITFTQFTAGVGANRALSNLITTLINQTLKGDTDNTYDLGTDTVRWASLYGSSIRAGSQNGNTLVLQARDVDGAAWTTFLTLTSANTPTCQLNNPDITGGTITNLTTPLAVNSGGIGVTTLTTAYGTLCAGTTATNPVQTVSPGSAGQVLTSNGNAALPSYQANAGASAGLILIATATAANSATIDFSNNLSATYDNYMVVIEDTQPATSGGILWMRIGTGAGPTYQTASYSGSGANSLVMSSASYNAFAEYVGGGVVFVYSANTAHYKMLQSFYSYFNTAPAITYTEAQGVWIGGTNALTSLRFMYHSGNILTGTFKLYGFKNS
jgi:hypothetical protein